MTAHKVIKKTRKSKNFSKSSNQTDPPDFDIFFIFLSHIILSWLTLCDLCSPFDYHKPIFYDKFCWVHPWLRKVTSTSKFRNENVPQQFWNFGIAYFVRNPLGLVPPYLG